MTKLFFEMNAYDITTRITNEGRVPLAPLVHVHELHAGGLVMRDENVAVMAALVDHRPVAPHLPIALTLRTDRPSSLEIQRHLTIS